MDVLHIDMIVNFEDDEISVSFDMDAIHLKDLMGAAEYAMKKELPKFGHDIKDYTSLLITVVPHRMKAVN